VKRDQEPTYVRRPAPDVKRLKERIVPWTPRREHCPSDPYWISKGNFRLVTSRMVKNKCLLF
jgi:hypothetical protein